MRPKYLYLLLVAIVAISSVAGQNEDEIPVENDNQFPPDKTSDIIEGSGDGVIEEPGELDGITTEAAQFPIERIQPKILLDDTETSNSEGDALCPSPCVCRVEGSSNDFIVDCSGYDLTELPTNININATVLHLQKNKLTEIPKEISSLKKLKILNANDNLIMNIALGSISELSALTTLKLRNNRLVEYPQDLKNSFGLTNLEELDLGNNDMRTELTSDLFDKFDALRTIILPSSGSGLAEKLCKALPKKLENVCIQTCDEELIECTDEGEAKDNLAVLPSSLSPLIDEDDNTESIINSPNEEHKADLTTEVPLTTTGEFSFRSAVNKQPSDEVLQNTVTQTSEDKNSSDQDVNVGATTSNTNSGGVDKSIIGLVVAGMVVIVAGITIKKNWSSIKKRFSSNSPTPNERNSTNVNGTTPEEVPLQDKSPV